jgi:gas vesicle protein
MKKMLIALVAMFVMTMSANAQSNENNGKLTFDRVASFLELRTNQVESVKTAMAQFESSMQAYNQLQDSSKAGEAWEKIQARHKTTMKSVLDEKQYNKYIQMLDLTVKNTAERIMDEATAAK